ncbi:MAG TPA: endopeptidase La [Armatimonadota bacterium]|nr:endopeptidase La [Armatimonadota bacterium]
MDDKADETIVSILETARDQNKLVIPDELSLLPLRETALFPMVVSPLTAGRESSIKLIDDAVTSGNRVIAVATMRNPEAERPTLNDIYPVGTAVVIHTMMRLPDVIRLIVQGVQRIRIKEATQTEPYLKIKVEVLPEKIEYTPEESTEIEALRRNVGGLFQKVVALSPSIPDELQAMPTTITQPSLLADSIASNLPLPTAEKQQLLEIVDIRERLRRLTAILSHEVEVLELGSRIQSQVQKEMTKTQREYYLREQLKAIQRELGEADERTLEVQELKEKIEAAKMPEEADKVATRELDRLQRMPPAAPEYSVSRNYIDWLVALPWSISTEDNLEVPHVKRILDEDHYGLEKVKERILEYLSVRKFKASAEVRQPILCFVGPPGVGKTSLGMSIARALGRKFVRLSLGGIRDEAEIRGHRRTYVGALPGQIIQGIRRTGSNNPVFMMDEVDKVGVDFRGDPSAALLEVLDPEQNCAFRDHYIEVPFDLSKTLFITTANILDLILPPLKDRMEILELAGYTEEEKLMIAKRHLVPKQLAEHGLKLKENIVLADDALRMLIRGYTREAGVRNLEREIAAICRKVTRQFAEGRTEPVHVQPDTLTDYLGAPRFQFEEVLQRTRVPGVATALAWTPVGGDVMFVEATRMPGRRELMLTGMLGDVMKESAQAALSYVRSHAADLKVDPQVFARSDIHLHVPAGAIPKDGPSAGITIATALASLMTGRPVRPEVAMSGEITLTGRVLPVGGIKEKVLAARRAGIKTVILPAENKKDVDEDVPEQVRKELDLEFVQSVDEVFKTALEPQSAEEEAVE